MMLPLPCAFLRCFSLSQGLGAAFEPDFKALMFSEKLDRGAKNALRHEERHRNKQPPQHKQPIFRELGREPAFAQIDRYGANDRADQGTASADRSPDNHFDGVGRGKFTRIDDANERHIKSSGDPGHHGRQGKDKQLHMLDAIAKKAGAAFRIAGCEQHLAEFRAHDG